MTGPTSKKAIFNVQPILLTIGFLVLIGLSIVTVMLVERAADDADSVAHTITVQNRLLNVLLEMRRAESSQRGYLLSSADNYLTEYNDAGPSAEKQLQDLRDLTADNPDRKGQLDAAKQLMDAKFSEMDRTIELTRNGRKDEALALVLNNIGQETMLKLRQLLDRLSADEDRLLQVRVQSSQRTGLALLWTSLIGALVIVMLGGAAVYLTQRNLRERERARQELAVTNSNLERIVEFRTADLTEANEEIQRFAYIVSHDLRSPLVNIMGFTSELEALRKDIFGQIGQMQARLLELNALAESTTPVETLGQDFDEALSFIKTSIAKMDRLINAVLKLSREGRRQFAPERIDMNEMTESVIRSVAHRAAEQGASVTADALPEVESDRLAIEQIFTNLVDNALKYSREGVAGHVEISGTATRTHVIYNVKDNGRGIDPKDHQRVFELFRRSGVQDRPGEGIGLAHVRALVRRLGGTMTLTSALNEGSTFTVTLPRRWSGENRSVA